MAAFLLTYAFRCGEGNSANTGKLLLAADNRTELERIICQTYLGCKFC